MSYKERHEWKGDPNGWKTKSDWSKDQNNDQSGNPLVFIIEPIVSKIVDFFYRDVIFGGGKEPSQWDLTKKKMKDKLTKKK